MRVLIAATVQVLTMGDATDKEAAGVLYTEPILVFFHGPWSRKAPEVIHDIWLPHERPNLLGNKRAVPVPIDLLMHDTFCLTHADCSAQ